MQYIKPTMTEMITFIHNMGYILDTKQMIVLFFLSPSVSRMTASTVYDLHVYIYDGKDTFY